MDISYPTRIVTGSYNGILKETTEYYNKLITYLIHVIEKEQTDIIIKDVEEHENERVMRLEALIHATKNNERPKYEDFDKEFPKFPSYIRRAAEKKAIGIYKSWYSNHLNWEIGGKKGAEPRLQYKHDAALAFYNKNAYRKDSEKGENCVQLKLWDGKNWVWTDLPVRRQDVKYINGLGKQYKISNAPTLTRRGHAWELRFAFKVKLDLADEDEQLETGSHRICAIDLGVNTDATCCIMEPDGTVVARRFINLGAEKDRILNAHKRIREAQSNGATKLRKMWRKVNRLNNDLVIKIVNEIVDFAVEYSCCAIACEYLDFSNGKRKSSNGKRHGKRSWRLHLWRYRDVYHRLCVAAHKWGLRVHQVCAWGTSQLAFDGSGRVSRGKYIVGDDGESLGLPYSIVRFSSGKFYNADLNAAYNIGARYYIRLLMDFLKAHLSSEDFGALSAKVPQCSARSKCVLSDLIDLLASGLLVRACSWADGSAHLSCFLIPLPFLRLYPSATRDRMEFPPWTIRSSITTHEKVCRRPQQPEAHDFSRVYFTRHTSTRFAVLPAGLSGTADAAVGEASRAARNAADTNAPPVTAGWR